jgi:uncharacterized protein YkwD
MPRVSRILFSCLLGTVVVTVPDAARLSAGEGSGSGHPYGQASSQAVSRAVPKAALMPVAATAADIPFDDADTSAEHALLQLANQSRAKAGAPALTLDSGLSHAARIHAEAMLAARQLSHQFEGEPALPHRLAATTNLQLDREGENVAFDYDAEHGHEHLMLSPPHRANLLNPAYNVVGLGVVRSGDRLYIVEDFGHALPRYSLDEFKDRVAAAVSQTRQQVRQPQLQRVDQIEINRAACSMAQADKLGVDAVRRLAARSTILSYTSLSPDALPSGAERAIAGRNLHSLSIGACYARTETYPTGMYWIALSLN